MRAVIYTDPRGYRHRAFVRDTDGDEMARSGIPADPPDVEDIDWEYVKREIHNALVDNGLFTWNDINKSTVGFNVATSIVKKHLSGIFHEKARQDKNKQTL